MINESGVDDAYVAATIAVGGVGAAGDRKECGWGDGVWWGRASNYLDIINHMQSK